MDAQGFDLAAVARGAALGVTHLPLACALADYCEVHNMTQADLMRVLHISPDSLKRLALVNVDIPALVDVLQAC